MQIELLLDHILANMLNKYKNKNNIAVVGIPRGGIIIADIVSRKLSLQSFNIVLSKRLRNPFNFENTVGFYFPGWLCLSNT